MKARVRILEAIRRDLKIAAENTAEEVERRDDEGAREDSFAAENLRGYIEGLDHAIARIDEALEATHA